MACCKSRGVRVGWVSILTNEDLRKILLIPEHVRPVAYLCLGYVREFANKPDLENAGWLSRLELSEVICYEKWGVAKLDLWSEFCNTFKDGDDDNVFH
jgi:5,6-dimethylbenzimidazole synthase